MRLLNTTTLQPEEYVGNVAIPYAILSHTWGEHEVSLRDLEQRQDVSKRKEYSKIYHACAQARADGYRFLWIDTCCIDKSSSAELSGAINSMFDWYAEAQTCYAYLSDVHGPFQGQENGDEKDLDYRPKDDISSRSFTLDDSCPSTWPALTNQRFQGSRWFTRGWTLQELIASKEVVFFDADWKCLGYRNSNLRDVISAITKIWTVFGGYMKIAHQFTVAQKMSWASPRSTTRSEDEAYCLLGILGVNLPLMYREGCRAFRRLQEAVIRSSTDHSILCHSRLSQGELLAESASDFGSSQHIGFPLGRRRQDEFEISNRGLRITAPIFDMGRREDVGPRRHAAALNCVNGDRPVILSLISDDVDQPATHFHLSTELLKPDRGLVLAAPKRSILVALTAAAPYPPSRSLSLRIRGFAGLQPHIIYIGPPWAAQVFNSTCENGPITATWHRDNERTRDLLACVFVSVRENVPWAVLRYRRYASCGHQDLEALQMTAKESAFIGEENVAFSWLSTCRWCLLLASDAPRNEYYARAENSGQYVDAGQYNTGHYIVAATCYHGRLDVWFRPAPTNPDDLPFWREERGY